MFGQRYPKLAITETSSHTPSPLEISARFQSIGEAKSQLSLLASAVFRLRGDLLKMAKDAVVYPTRVRHDSDYEECYLNAFCQSVSLGLQEEVIMSRKSSLKQELASFWEAFEHFIHAHGKVSARSSMAIQIEHIQIFILLEHCRNTYETAYDTHNDTFRTAIDLATAYLNSAPRASDSQPKRAFALEPGILPTVFLVVEKCREPQTRQRAINLMREGCAQEAMWDGKPYATFMQRLADIESRHSGFVLGQNGLKHLQMATSTKTQSDIPEVDRYCSVVYAGDACSAKPARLVCARRRHETDGMIEMTEHEVDLKADMTYLNEICYGRR